METGPDPLSRRERQIMDIVYRLERASASEVRDAMDDAPSYSTVRALLATLERKEQLTHEQDGPRYVYRPTVPPDDARRSELARVVHNFFGGRPEDAAVALLEMTGLPGETLDELSALVEQAREEGR